MFSSLASIFFGSNTNPETNSENTATPNVIGLNEENDTSENFINVTSLTPLEDGDSTKARGKNKRNKINQQKKRKGIKTLPSHNTKQVKVLPANNCIEEEFDEDGWFIVKNEEDKREVSSVRNDSEEENLPVNNLPQQQRQQNNNFHSQKKQRNRKNTSRIPSNGLNVSKLNLSCTSSDGCSDSKHEADAGMTSSTKSEIEVGDAMAISESTHEALADAGMTSSTKSKIKECDTILICESIHEAIADASMTCSTEEMVNDSNGVFIDADSTCSANSQVEESGAMSICESKHEVFAHTSIARSINSDIEDSVAMLICGLDAPAHMEESWLVTPPPCFTSTGPTNVDYSPYENLLIEHPSMSVYYKIKNDQKSAESLTKLTVQQSLSDEYENLSPESSSSKSTVYRSTQNGNEDTQSSNKPQIAVNYRAKNQKVNEPIPQKKFAEAAQPRRKMTFAEKFFYTYDLLKRDVMGYDTQKIKIKHDQQEKSRSALKRTNKARDVQSKNHVQRRSDHQYSKHRSNANNNRKSNCY